MWVVNYISTMYVSCILICFSCFFSQDDHISRRSGLHLCDLCHVLCAGQLCPFSDWGASQQSQTPSVCQWRQTDPLLAGQLHLGHGQYSREEKRHFLYYNGHKSHNCYVVSLSQCDNNLKLKVDKISIHPAVIFNHINVISSSERIW